MELHLIIISINSWSSHLLLDESTSVSIEIDFEEMNFNLDLGIDFEFPLFSNVDVEFECIVKINILDIDIG